MAEPINFRRDVASPFASAIQGYQLGMGLRQAEAKATFEQQARQFELQRQQKLSEAFQRLQRPDASGEDYRNAMILSDKDTAQTLQKAFEMRTTEQNEAALKKMSPVLFALRVGKKEDAINLLNQEIEANRNSNNPQVADALGRYVQILETGGPEAADIVREAWMGEMSFIPGADKVIKNINDVSEGFAKEQRRPFELIEAKSNAEKAAIDARFAESNAVMDLEKKGWDIKKLQNDMAIANQNARIAAINADISRETNALKRQELQMKLDQAERERDEKVRTKVADLETASGNIDNMLNTADRILKTPKSVIGSAAGPISSRVLTVSQDTADFEELVTTLGSQAFLAQIPNIKGMGALSNAEGEKLTAALQNFSLRQSPERLVENVREAQRLLLKARKNIAERSGLPQTPQDRPASAASTSGAPAGGPRAQQPVPGTPLIDSLLQKYGAQ